MFKFFTSDLRRNIVKVICLTVGMALGFILMAKVYFEQTYDTFFADSEQLYIINEHITDNDIHHELMSTSAGVAHGFKRYLPQVESATHTSSLLESGTVMDDDGRSFDMKGIILADSSFFDVVPRKIISGDPREFMNVANRCIIPKSLADIIGGDVVGKELRAPDLSEEYSMIVGGVYEDLPLNSIFPNAIYLSMVSAGQFFYYDPENMFGNDRYTSFVKLYPDVDPQDLKPGIGKMIEDNVDKHYLDLYKYDLSLKPLVGAYSSLAAVRLISALLFMLALVIIICAGINYLLVTLGQMNARSKEMAIRKCYGTSNKKIFIRVIGECIFYLGISCFLALLFILSMSSVCEEILGVDSYRLLTTGKVWLVEFGVIALLVIITGIIPAWIYCNVPVAHAFKMKIRTRKNWKKSMLFIQMFATGALVCLLMLIVRQFNYISSADLGFDYENVGMVYIKGCSTEKSNLIASELRRLGCVDKVASGKRNILYGGGGNSIFRNNDFDNPCRVEDMEYVNRDYFDVWGIEFVQGDNFHENVDSMSTQVIVEERFIEVLNSHFGHEGNDIIGESFSITGHGDRNVYTICGVVENTRRGNFQKKQKERDAAIFFPTRELQPYLYVRFSSLTKQNLAAAQHVIDKIVTDRDLYITPYKVQIDTFTEEIRKFGLAVLIVGVAILLISLTGLIGYVGDEVVRRSKEVAIRKINGYHEKDILRLFCNDILIVGLSSFSLGALAAYILGKQWLSFYSEQVGMSPLSFIVVIIGLLILIAGVVALNSIKVARGNPVKYLRNE